jgi:ribonuclease HI
METSQAPQVRCPCCNETFTLTDELYVKPVPAQQPAQPAQPAQPVQPVQPNLPPGAIPITLIFDGGSIGNPGQGYGSYQLTVEGRPEEPKRLQFGSNYTNNEAEYDTLIAALEAILLRARDPHAVYLDIRGDSQLVIKQITGQWKVKEPRMQQRVQQVHMLLQHLGGWRASWHGRQNSVDALGH